MAKKKSKSTGRGGARRGAGRPSDVKNTTVVAFSLTDSQIKYIERYKKKNGLASRSQTVRKIIDEFKKQNG